MPSLIVGNKPITLAFYFNFLRSHRFALISPVLSLLKIPTELLSPKFDLVEKNLSSSASVIFRLTFFDKTNYFFILQSIRLGCFHNSQFNLLTLFKFWYLSKLLNCITIWSNLLYLLPSITTSSIEFHDCFLDS